MLCNLEPLVQIDHEMEEFQSSLELNRFQQHDFLYPLIFQESIFALAHDHGFNLADFPLFAAVSLQHPLL